MRLDAHSIFRKPKPRVPVNVLLSDRHACGHYRLLFPSVLLRRAGYPVFVGQEVPGHPPAGRGCWVTQRQYFAQQVGWLRRYTRAGHHVVLDLDDLLWDFPPGHPSPPPRAHRENLLRAVREVSLVTVSTPYLAERLRERVSDCAPIEVIENRAPSEFLAPVPVQRRLGERLRVLYTGSTTHGPDIALIAQAVKATAGKVDWVFFRRPPKGVAQRTVRCAPQVPFETFPARLRELAPHVVVAPLVDHPFNRAKSPLKLFEAAYAGAACIASDLEPYAENPGPKLPAAASPQEADPQPWIDALRRYEADDALRLRDARRLLRHVRRRWALENRGYLRRIEKAWVRWTNT